MKMFRVLVLALPFTLALAPSLAAADNCDTATRYPTCHCPTVVDPVCGMDGKTYGNSCVAACECVDIAYAGDCDDACTKYCGGTAYDPICGADGETYGNECYADCLGAKIDHEGECGPVISPGPNQ